MIKAILMCGEQVLKIDPFPEPMPYIRYCVASTYDLHPWDDSSSTTSMNMRELFKQEMIFRLVRRVGQNEYEYQYEKDYRPTNQQFIFTIHERITGGFQEPDENVNLGKLTIKLRNKKEMKDLLLRFFRS